MKIVTFSAIDASNYHAGLGTITAARLLNIDYEENSYRWQACDSGTGAPLDSAVFGSAAPAETDAAEADAAAHIRADIALTIPE